MAEEGIAFVPAGASYWEMGTDRDVKGKADDDFEKRTTTPLGAVPSTSSFVFVTPRRWSKKQDWVDACAANGAWKDVRVIDADDLDLWSETAPAVKVWLSRLLGKLPQGVVDLDGWFEEWASVTSPSMSPDVALAGRGVFVQQVHRWLQGPPSALSIQGETVEEVLAVVSALARQSAPVAERFRAVGVIVENMDAWRDLSLHEGNLVLIANFDAPKSGVLGAVGASHHVLIPFDRSAATTGAILRIPALNREAAEAALIAQGLDERRARRAVSHATRSLTVLRRHLSPTPAVVAPAWAWSEHVSLLTRVLLVESWNERSPSDVAVIERVSGRPYAEIEAGLVAIDRMPDAPIRRHGSVWTWQAPEDAWTYLADRLVASSLAGFSQSVLDVLGAPLPKYELPAGERYAAAIHGRASPYSKELRTSLATTLARLAARADALSESVRIHTATIADQLVARILERPTDWRIWASLAGDLPVLAEAAPDMLMDAIDAALKGDTDWKSLFEEGGFTSAGSHTGMLWALELLAWHAPYLSRVAIQLAQLDSHDAGGQWVNRPINSLLSIFSSWYPQTEASLSQRLRAIDVVIKRAPAVGWKLLLALIPEGLGGFATPNPVPRWRTWARTWKGETSQSAFREHMAEVAKRLRAMAGNDPARWLELVERVDDLLSEDADAVVDHAFGQAAAWPAEARASLRTVVREILHKHRQFPDADWVLSPAQLERLATLHETLKPDDPVEASAWLFQVWPHVPAPPPAPDHEAERAMIDAAQKEAMEAIFASGGVAAVLSLAARAKDPHVVGARAAERVRDGEADALVQRALEQENAGLRSMVDGFLHVRSRLDLDGTAAALQRLALDGGWSAELLGRAATALPATGKTWDLVHGWGPAVEDVYWKAVDLDRYSVPAEDLDRAARELLSRGRPDAVVSLCGWHDAGKGNPLPVASSLLLDALETLATAPGERGRLESHDVESIFDGLGADPTVDRSRLVKLEFLYLPLFEHRGFGSRVLSEEMNLDPSIFVDIISAVYRDSRVPDAPAPDATSVAVAQYSYRLLRAWKGLPGRGHDGAFDGAKLRAWFDAAQTKCREAGRADVGDEHLGEILARSPVGEDGRWPHETVRDILDASTKPVLDGFVLAIRNSRGIVKKKIGEGGEQERQLASHYEAAAEAVAIDHPRTAAALRRVVRRYRTAAAEEDAEAEMD